MQNRHTPSPWPNPDHHTFWPHRTGMQASLSDQAVHPCGGARPTSAEAGSESLQGHSPDAPHGFTVMASGGAQRLPGKPRRTR